MEAFALGTLFGLLVAGVSLHAVLRERRRQLAGIVLERDAARAEQAALARELTKAETTISGLRSQHEVREQTHKERLNEIDTRFKGIASDVLQASSAELRRQAAEQFKQHQALAKEDLTARGVAIENIVRPVQENLEKLRKHVDASDKARVADTSLVSQSVERLMKETSGLRKILHNPQLRGQWGEQHLRNVLETAGMTSHVDYLEQSTIAGTADGAGRRPDVLVKIPGGVTVVIDAKTPHEHYDHALQCDNEQRQATLLRNHAGALKEHAKNLARRDYSQWIKGSPDFVMMYVPTDPMLDAAVVAEPTIWQDTWQRDRVLIATPGLLIAFLRTVALAWQQQDIQQNAEEIADTGRKLYSRLCTYVDHIDKLGRGLHQAVEAYNHSVGSFQSRVLVQARRFEELGATGQAQQIKDPSAIDRNVRQVDAPDLTLSAPGI